MVNPGRNWARRRRTTQWANNGALVTHAGIIAQFLEGDPPIFRHQQAQNLVKT
jgi:hypothetical protein